MPSILLWERGVRFLSVLGVCTLKLFVFLNVGLLLLLFYYFQSVSFKNLSGTGINRKSNDLTSCLRHLPEQRKKNPVSKRDKGSMLLCSPTRLRIGYILTRIWRSKQRGKNEDRQAFSSRSQHLIQIRYLLTHWAESRQLTESRVDPKHQGIESRQDADNFENLTTADLQSRHRRRGDGEK